GFGRQIERSGNDFYAHKNGFTRDSLTRVLGAAGFGWVFTALGPFEIRALAFKQAPTAQQKTLLGLPA
ncbi:MAG TPA: hypothetical protein VM051_13410, partial [Usitatibacter sp.]|nr:hypothetical protein [Usitatibacter sp.]